MERILTYAVGCLIISPIAIGLVSDDVIIIALSLIYGLGVFFSPSFSASVRRFWRRWHRENYRIINTIK